MFFWILLLAHEIADFPLQIDSIYKLKSTSRWGVIPHIFICTIINIIILLPFLSSGKVWVAILFLTIVHFMLDKTKIAVFSKNTGDNFLNFCLDQFLHIISIWIAAWWLDSVNYNSFVVPNFYHNTPLLIALSLSIFTTFGGTPVVFYAHKYWNTKNNRPPAIYPIGMARMPGIFERGLATTAIITTSWGFLVAPILFIPIIFLDKTISLLERIIKAFAGLGISLFCGIIYYAAIGI